jgi:AraC-like DNA-binding protein
MIAFFQKYGIIFKHPYFVVVLINMNYKECFFEEYNYQQQQHLRQSIINLYKEYIPSDYCVYEFNMYKTGVCFIINASHETIEGDMGNISKNFIDLFKFDDNYVNITIGIGNTHKGLAGIGKSFNEAEKALTFLPTYSTEHIAVYSDHYKNALSLYSISDENKLFNYLIVGNKDKAFDLIHEIVDMNIKNNATELVLKELYLKIRNTAIRVLNIKNTCLDELLSEKSHEDIDDFSLDALEKYVFDIIDEVTKLSSVNTVKIDVAKIIEFIEQNSEKDLYLEMIAELYGTSAKYLSRLIKEHLGIGFSEFLAGIRISKAKMLISSQTQKSINEIAIEVGFNNNNTFYRAFKKAEGITPSEYRERI